MAFNFDLLWDVAKIPFCCVTMCYAYQYWTLSLKCCKRPWRYTSLLHSVSSLTTHECSAQRLPCLLRVPPRFRERFSRRKSPHSRGLKSQLGPASKDKQWRHRFTFRTSNAGGTTNPARELYPRKESKHSGVYALLD